MADSTYLYNVDAIDVVAFGAHPDDVELSAGGTLKPLRHWASQQPGAVVEFGEERLFIRGARKLCLDASGQPLWATHIGNDPDEQRNRIGALHQSQPRWIRLLEWAGQEQLRRSTGAWIWRNLTNA